MKRGIYNLKKGPLVWYYRALSKHIVCVCQRQKVSVLRTLYCDTTVEHILLIKKWTSGKKCWWLTYHIKTSEFQVFSSVLYIKK